MSSPPPSDGRVRSLAEELNERIRAFWTGPGAHPTLPLTEAQRAEYQLLLAELWKVEQLERGEIVEAA